jgi:23S rRNA pseudouridine1911/1915/1917 synthase
VVDKPAGLVVHPAPGNWHGTLVNGLLARFPELVDVGVDPSRPGVVHRLDRDTSGLLVVARTQDAYHDLVGQLQQRTVEREYLALVWGHLATRSGMVDGPIGRSRRDATKRTVTAAGKEAKTLYDVDTVYHRPVDATLLRCRLLTGRTHQIRVHMQSIGHPVVGDATYGGWRQSFPMPRMFLHAARLGFRHPTPGAELRFTSPLPADLAEVLRGLS